MEETASAREATFEVPGGGGWGAVLLLGSTLGVTQLSYYLTASALPLYLRDLGASAPRIGLEVGLGNIAGVVATLALGPALNRYGPRLFLGLSAFVYVVAACGMLFVHHEIPVTSFRVLQGIGAGLILPAAMTHVALLVPRRTGTALGAMGALNGFSMAAAPPIGLFMYLRYGASGLFLPAFAAAVLGLVAVARLPGIRPEGHHASGFGFDTRWLPLLLANGLAAVYFGGILSYLALYLRHLHGPNAGIFFTADAVGVLLLRLPTGWLADRRGSLLPKILGLTITLPGIAILGLPPTSGILIASGAMTGIGAGLFITGLYADMARRSSAVNRGTAMSLSSASFGFGIFLGSAVSGLLLVHGGFEAILIFGIVTCIVALPLAIVKDAGNGTAVAVR